MISHTTTGSFVGNCTTRRLALGVMWCASAVGVSSQPVADYKAVTCPAPLPYEGRPLYAGRPALPIPGSVLGSRFDAATEGRLQAAMDTATSKGGFTAATAAVASDKGFWSTTLNAQRKPIEQRLYWASIGKALTATVILQMVEEGKLALADPISRWDSTVPNAGAITIDDLLHHTAGLFSANEDLVFHKKPRYLTPDQSIAISTKHGAMFCPGQNWRYSNTGYVLLGKVIEAVDGMPYHQAVNTRIIKRLGQTSLRCLAPNETPADLADFGPAQRKDGFMAPNWGFAAGAVIGTAADMTRFWHALMTSQLLKAETTLMMFDRLYPMFDSGTFYGRGVMVLDVPEGNGPSNVWLGHGGGAPGMQAIVAYSQADKAFVAVSVAGTLSSTATAYLLLKQLRSRPPTSNGGMF